MKHAKLNAEWKREPGSRVITVGTEEGRDGGEIPIDICLTYADHPQGARLTRAIFLDNMVSPRIVQLPKALSLLADLHAFVSDCCQTGDIWSAGSIDPMGDDKRTVAEVLKQVAALFDEIDRHDNSVP